MKRVLLVCLVVAAGVFAACKSGEGERCQIKADCADGLECNMAKNTCQSTTGGDLDADVHMPTPDAMVDAMDAMVDAPDAM